MTEPLVGGLEAGGTKFVCAVGTGPDDVRSLERFPTRGPEETLDRAALYFEEAERRHGPLEALGVGCFGPVDLDPDSPGYGSTTTTPKEGWTEVGVRSVLAARLGLPVAFDTDVNAAALAEWRWGAGRGLRTFVYLTVGTGIGGGAVVGGELLHGLVHPEMGHLLVGRDRAADRFEGSCPFHGDCLEGLASGSAVEKRWAAPCEALPPEHEAWRLEADYLAAALVDLVFVLSPERIVLGGGVMQVDGLLERVRRRVGALLGGYLRAPELAGDLGRYLVRPELGDRAGVLGAIALAQGETARRSRGRL